MDKKTSYHDMIQGFGLFIFFLQLIPRIKDFIKHYGSGYTPGRAAEGGAGYFGQTVLGPLYWDTAGLLDHSKYEEFAESALDSCAPLEQLFTT